LRCRSLKLNLVRKPAHSSHGLKESQLQQQQQQQQEEEEEEEEPEEKEQHQ